MRIAEAGLLLALIVLGLKTPSLHKPRSIRPASFSPILSELISGSGEFAASLGVLVVLLATVVAVRADADEPLVVAQPRSDGIVVPFARFDGDQWSGFAPEELGLARGSESYWLRLGADGGADTLHGSVRLEAVAAPDGERDVAFRGQITNLCPREVASDGAGAIGVVLSDGRHAAAFEVVGKSPRRGSA